MSDDVQRLTVGALDSAQQARELAERALARVTVLQQLTSALGEALTVAEVGAVIMNQGIAALMAQSGRLAVLQDNRDYLDVIAYSGHTTVRTPLRLDEPLPTTEVVRTGQPLFVSTSSEISARFPEIGTTVSPLTGGALAATPLIVRGRVIGALTLVFAEDRDIDDDERELLIAVGGQAAQALERARLYELSLQIQEDLRRSRDQLAAILGGIAEGVTVQDAEGRLIYANHVAAEMTGIASPAELGQTWTSHFLVFDETGQPLAPENLPGRRLLRGERPDEIVVEFRDLRTGLRHWAILDATAVRDDSGNLQLIVNIFRDISERKRQIDATVLLAEVGTILGSTFDLENSLQRLADLLTTRRADWCVIDLQEPDAAAAPRRVAVAHADRGADALAEQIRRRTPDLLERAPHYSRPTLLSSTDDPRLWTDVVDADCAAVLRQVDAQSGVVVDLHARGQVLGRMWLISCSSDRTFQADDLDTIDHVAARTGLAIVSAYLYREAQEQAQHQVALNTALRAAIEERDRALIDVRQALRTRDEFLASAAHDLKNPLASIKAGAQLLQRRLSQPLALDADALRQGLQRLDAIASRAAGLVDELLDQARLQMGTPLELDRRACDLVALVGEVALEQQQQTEQHTIVIDTALNELPGTWDGRRLGRVLSNLLDNAVKYSPRGGMIVVRIHKEAGEAVVEVEDDGIGIPREDQARIFERFQRASNVERRIGGTGIGLASARHIVESHDGTLTVTSRENDGSVFSMRLPLDA